MPNTARTQLSPKSVPRRSQQPQQVTTLRSVRQDNPAHPRARTATPQPAPHTNVSRAQTIQTPHPRSQTRPNTSRKTVHLTLWVKPVVKAELERIAEQEGLSISSAGAAFLENAIQTDIHTQHGALLDTILDKAIAKHLRSYSSRIAVLLVRSLFASEQTRSIVTNILSRHPGVTQEALTHILNRSSNAAKRNITHVTPQLATLLHEVEQWMREEGKTDA
jgi:hypothetical protein